MRDSAPLNKVEGRTIKEEFLHQPQSTSTGMLFAHVHSHRYIHTHTHFHAHYTHMYVVKGEK